MERIDGPKQQDMGVDEVVGDAFNEASNGTSGVMETHQQVRNKYQDGTVDAVMKQFPSEDGQASV